MNRNKVSEVLILHTKAESVQKGNVGCIIDVMKKRRVQVAPPPPNTRGTKFHAIQYTDIVLWSVLARMAMTKRLEVPLNAFQAHWRFVPRNNQQLSSYSYDLKWLSTLVARLRLSRGVIIVINLLTAIGLTPGGSGYIHVHKHEWGI